MLKFFKSIEKTLIFVIKGLMFIGLFLAFFLPYVPQVPQLIAFSRIAAIPMSSFAILGICFIKIYGGFAIGVKKSREIIYSVMLAAAITDVITYLQLSIMIKSFANFYYLLLAMVAQYIVIYVATRFGNFIYFAINQPAKCVVVYSDESMVPQYLRKIGRYKRQWVVKDVVHYSNEDVKALIRHNDTVFFFDTPRNVRSELIEYCYKHNKNIFASPDVADVVIKYSDHVLLDDMTVFGSLVGDLTFEQKLIKRAFDVILSGIGLIVASPIMLAEVIAIKLCDKGPVLFKQARLTKGGREFNVLKFRTMVVDAEKQDVAVLSSKHDSRVTPVGRVLRATRIDELPQLINIFRGDMSIVGPRPERASIAEEYEKDLPEFRYRLKVKAGLTGLAQIMGKYNTTPKDKLTLDLVYIEQYSIWLDLKIMLQTAKVLFKSDSTEGFDEDDKIEFVKHEAGQPPEIELEEENDESGI